MSTQREKLSSRFRTVPKGGRFFVFYLLRSPEEPCPLFEYCVVETAYTLLADWVFDLRRGEVQELLDRPEIQQELGLIYERPPKDWRSIRAEPLLVTRLLENMMASWPSVLPLRVLLIYDRQDEWWVEIATERFRASRTEIQVERVSWEGCHPARCSLLRSEKDRGPEAESSSSKSSTEGSENFSLMVRPSPAPCFILPASPQKIT